MDLGLGTSNQIMSSPLLGTEELKSSLVFQANDLSQPKVPVNSFADLLSNQIADLQPPMEQTTTLGINPANMDLMTLPSEGPMQSFLRTIEEKAGVSGDNWVNAMLSVAPADQLESPWSTAEVVVDQLGLTTTKREFVLNAYEKLLADIQKIEDKNQTESKDISPELAIALAPLMATALPTQTGIQVSAGQSTSANSLSAAALPAPLGLPVVKQAPRISSKPAMPLAKSSPETPALVPGSLTPELKENSEFKSLGVEPQVAKLESQKLTQSFVKPTPDQIKEVNIDKLPKKLEATLKAIEQKDLGVDVQGQFEGENFFEEALVKDKFSASDINSAKFESPEVQNFNKSDFTQFKMNSNSEKKEEFLSNNENPETSQKSDSLESPKFFVESGRTQISKSIPTNTTLATASSVGVMSRSEGDMNTKELIRQAQFMVRQGGGEVRIKLSPENLGEINMKMTVNGDNVNLALDAESAEVKKLIENGIDDLRTSLSANKLNLESVKIEVLGKSDNHFSNHRHDGEGSANRDQARQFMNNFREENHSRRFAMSEESAGVSSRAQASPAVRGVQNKANYGRGLNSSGRLNLVA